MGLARVYGIIKIPFKPQLFEPSQVWHGAEERYSMIEKQLLAAYSSLQEEDPISQTS